VIPTNVIHGRPPDISKMYESNKKDRGLAILVVGGCHEMGIGEGLVNRLLVEAMLGAGLTFCAGRTYLDAGSRDRRRVTTSIWNRLQAAIQAKIMAYP
jgi:hypothetical protein